MFGRKKPKDRAQVLTRDQFSIRREVEYIIGQAQARESRVVAIGKLVLFSTESGDAWMLSLITLPDARPPFSDHPQ